MGTFTITMTNFPTSWYREVANDGHTNDFKSNDCTITNNYENVF